jgi:hypothetical protein
VVGSLLGLAAASGCFAVIDFGPFEPSLPKEEGEVSDASLDVTPASFLLQLSKAQLVVHPGDSEAITVTIRREARRRS